MSAVLVSIAFSLPGLWARIYTLGLPENERRDRILKVESDAFEQRAVATDDSKSLFPALEAFVCLAGSVWADLTWRLERGHVLRVEATRAGQPPFPGFAAALFGLAGIAAALRLSIFHDLDGFAHAALILALIAGPLLAVLGVVIARQSPFTGFVALTAGSAALVVAAWTTVVAPLAAVIGYGAGLLAILETRHAYRTTSAPGRSAAPANPLRPSVSHEEVVMESDGRLERWMSLGALAFIVSIGCSLWFAASDPHAPDSDAEIVSKYADANEASAYAAFLGSLVGGLGLLVFFSGLYPAMRRADPAGHLSALMLVAAGGAAVLWMLQNGLTTSIAMAYAYEENFRAAGVDPQTVRVLDVAGFALGAAAWAILALALGSLALVSLRSHAVVPAWLAWPAVAVAAVLLLAFPLFVVAPAAFGLWALVTSLWRLTGGSRALGPQGTPGVRTAPV